MVQDIRKTVTPGAFEHLKLREVEEGKSEPAEQRDIVVRQSVRDRIVTRLFAVRPPDGDRFDERVRTAVVRKLDAQFQSRGARLLRISREILVLAAQIAYRFEGANLTCDFLVWLQVDDVSNARRAETLASLRNPFEEYRLDPPHRAELGWERRPVTGDNVVRLDWPLMDENEREQSVGRVPPARPQKAGWFDFQMRFPLTQFGSGRPAIRAHAVSATLLHSA
jgi:hypothetical protein